MRLYCISCSACGAIYKVAEFGNGRRLARSKELLSLWCHAGKLVRPQAEGVQARHAAQAPLPACAASAFVVKAKSENREAGQGGPSLRRL